MTQEFDSSALELLNHAYGLSGVDAEQQTFLEDGHVQQLLPIQSIARRSRTPFGEGLFRMMFENDHGVGSELESFVDPYNPVNVANGYPASVDPRKFEVWALAATCQTTAGANMSTALIGYSQPSTLQGPSDTAAGGAVPAVARRTMIGGWTDFATFVDSLGVEYGATPIGALEIPFKRRLQAGERILFRTLSTGITTTVCALSCFIGPVTLGQDLY